ncbi:MAG: alkaline phosphatase family protein [Alphaproteobacteria bacterium]|nr:alkaline phosphatase family protein [Alphaproteobacteria bacterium]
MRTWTTLLAALALAACAATSAPPPADVAPRDPAEALADSFAPLIPGLPTAPAGPALPSSQAVLSEIAFGSCHTAERAMPILTAIVSDRPDLLVYMGDNVYGDARAGDMSLPELRTQYALLSGRSEFQAMRAAIPMLATWDDHDYGLNDAGGDFSGKAWSKRIFETYWGTGARTQSRDGIYDSHVFGPDGQRVQIILLDTRYARTRLTTLPERAPDGPYDQSADPNQRMLSDAQWSWLEQTLREPADLRFIVSSIQVLADGHHYEAWHTMPIEQGRLYDVVRRSGARGVTFVSGDRHIAGLYRQNGVLGYPAYEMTTSSLNLSFRDVSEERSSNQIGDMYAPVNYGVADIDWSARTVTFRIKDINGQPVREQAIGFAELGL